MPRGINKVFIMGHLGQDPDIRYMASGSAVANFSVATSESWKDKETGEKKEKTEWHRIVFYAKQAELIGEWFTKGDAIFVEGKIQTRKWQGQDGQDRYTTEIIGREFQAVKTKGKGEQPGPEENQGVDFPDSKPEESSGGDFPDDDIPF